MNNPKKIIQYGGPCKRQCKVDPKTLVCSTCKMFFGNGK